MPNFASRFKEAHAFICEMRPGHAKQRFNEICALMLLWTHALGAKLVGDQLASQISFDAETAVQTGVTQFGTKFNQLIPITGANGRVIEVMFAWIRNNDGIIRLVTGIPAKL